MATKARAATIANRICGIGDRDAAAAARGDGRPQARIDPFDKWVAEGCPP
jgi:hypothetical protein